MTKEQAVDLFTGLATAEGVADRHRFGDDGVLYVHHIDPDETTEIQPDPAGLYHLYELGWTFLECDG